MNSAPLLLVVVGILGFAASWQIVLMICTIGRRRGLLDRPNVRSSHTTPTPRGGGIAIAGLTIPGFVALTRGAPAHVVAGFAAGALLVGTISLIDDIWSIGAGVRLAAHSVAALIVIMTCGYITDFDVAGQSIHLGFAGAVLTLIWIVGLTNAYNFMDGIDGISGGQALIAASGWVILASLEHDRVPLILGILIASTSLGFLLHNWPPARIFMGDVGSAFLGFSFATLPLLSRQGPALFIVPAALFVWPFLFDTTLTFVRRLSRRENVFAAHRSHLYQRLNIRGYSHRWVSSVYLVLAGMGAAAAITSVYSSAALQVALIACALAAGLTLWLFVRHAERSRSHRADLPI